MDHVTRLKRCERTLIERDLDGFVVTHPANLRYLCGYTGSNGLLLFLAGRRFFLTDGRYTQQAHEEVRGTRVMIVKGELIDDAAKLIGRLNSAAVGFEAEYTSVTAAERMRKLVHNKIEWKTTTGLIMRQRMVKDADELRIISDAVKLGAAVYVESLPAICPGVREAEIASRLEYAAVQAGADGMSFGTIVAGGKRSALPHQRASKQRVPKHGFVVVDSGVILRGYCSDLTRTVHMGSVGREQRWWYEAVLEAQLTGIAAVAPGKTAGEVDDATRQVLRKAGLDRYFTHSTGHGVGLEIHEPPRLAKQQVEQLLPGMVITIEPGIYVPGKGGIRIEDMVVVTGSGSRVLTPVAKQLIEI